MQQEWKFKIEGHMIIPGMEDKTFNIYPENIKTLTRISDYIYKNEPMILLHLTIDKNFFDIVIQNAKTETMYLKIEKYNVNDDMDQPSTTIYIEDEFNVMVSNDINYNKELDYLEKDENGEYKRDVYRDLVIGLLSKKCIDANKRVANSVIYDSSMMDIVCSYMTDLHVLIEPFEHNTTREQLTIPPQDRLTKIIEYLNSVEVFYNTKYLFFIDEPYCTYLISRSGKGVPRADEPYSDVFINVRSVTDPYMAVQGMTEDSQKQQYVVDVPTVNTNFTIDHDAAKVYDKIQAVVNPNQDNDIDSNSSVEEAKKKISKYVGDYRAQVHKFSKETAEAVNKVNINANKFIGQVDDFMMPALESLQDIASTAIGDQLGSIPTSVSVKVGKTSVSVPLISGGFAGAAMGVMNGCFGKINSAVSGVTSICNSFGNLSSQLIPNYYASSKLDNYLGSVTETNAQDIISNTGNSTKSLRKNSSSLKSFNEDKILGKMDNITKITNNVASTVSKADDVIDKIDKIQSSSLYSKVVEQHEGIANTFDMIKQNVDKMKAMSDIIKDSCSQINTIVAEGKQTVNNLATFANDISNVGKEFSNIGKMDIKKNFCSINGAVNTVNQYMSSATKAFSSVGRALSSGLMTFDSIKLIGTSLNKINSINGIGKYGMSNFETDLQIGGCFGQGTDGTKIIKIKNDNPNEIKNIKSEMETMINQLSFNKQGLDPSVFTPNKKYIVSNYDAHSDKDGIFILNKKTEFFVREDESFTCNTILNLAKILEESTTEKVKDTSVTNNNTKVSDWKEQGSGKTMDTNSSINTDGKGSGELVKKTTTRDDSAIRTDVSQVMKFPGVIMH